MHFAVAYVLPTIIGCIQILSSLANPTLASDNEITTFSKSITRTVGGETISLAATCLSMELYCVTWCSIIPEDSAIKSPCEKDCEDGFCTLSSDKIEFPQNSDLFVYPSELVERARNEHLEQLYAVYHLSSAAHSSLQRRDLLDCMNACTDFEQFASQIKFNIARSLANVLARYACPAICIQIWTMQPGNPPRALS